MADPYLGEIRAVGFNFAPLNWALCNGQLLQVRQYTTLFSVIGTIYGGDGKVTFALPDLRSRVPLHWGTSPVGNAYTIGESSGSENVSVLSTQIPAHSHGLTHITANQPANTTAGLTNKPAANLVPAQAVDSTKQPIKMYAGAAGASMGMAPFKVAGLTQLDGGGIPHPNLQPLLTVNYIICLNGIFPSRN